MSSSNNQTINNQFELSCANGFYINIIQTMLTSPQGIFVAFVERGSPAALAGLRFGDQILQINEETVAGWDNDKVSKFVKKAAPGRITMAVRDRWVMLGFSEQLTLSCR